MYVHVVMQTSQMGCNSWMTYCKYIKDTQRKVSVFEHREGEWKKARLRLVRPISTVIMDNEVKDDILRDVDEFFDQDIQG